MSDDFSRFNQIFGVGSDDKKSKSPATPASKSKKRKSLPVFFVTPKAKVRQSPSCSRNQQVVESPDKQAIIPHLSCRAEDFEKDLAAESDDSSQENSNVTYYSKRPKFNVQPDVYSPDIEEFPDSDDIFNISQESEQIALVNNGITESQQRKTKYRPMNKIPKPGGLLEKLRAAKAKRTLDACCFAASSSNETNPNQRKIQVIQHLEFRRHIVLNFKFIDMFALDENSHYLVLPPDFGRFFAKHLFYDINFDLPEQEFIPQHFVHFGKQIRAAHQFY